MLLSSTFLALILATPSSSHPTTTREALTLLLGEAGTHSPRALARARALFGGGSEPYSPYQVACPSDLTWVRPADSLSSGEQAYLASRQQYLNPAIDSQLAAVGLPQPPRTPVISFALSGGGYRAMIVGLGGVMATMNGSMEAAASGIGGWFEGVTYMAGLSGGSWGTGTFMANGGMLPYDLITDVWDLGSNLILPSDDKITFYTDLIEQVQSKSGEGFPTQITDYWALALGNHLLPVQYRLDNSPNLTLSQLPSVVPALGNASLPMPIIIAAEREAGEVVVPENSTLFEFTPFEFGSWAFGSTTKVPGAFTPLDYLGSSVDNGQANGTCWKGFDQLSFVMGSSSTLFNGLLLDLNSTDADSLIVDALKAVLEDVGEDDNDVARIPNSFANWNTSANPISSNTYITLVDAGETNQNVPLEPLLVPHRNVDAIIAFDNSADTTYSWPNGTALTTTYQRVKQFSTQQGVQLLMPAVPSENGFINGGLNSRPTFFGCNETTTPLIVYVPNYPWSYYSNVSTYQLEYDNTTAQNVMLSGLRSLTLNGSVSTWPTCLACALTDRANSYTSANRSATCASCFSTWCWNGMDNITTPNEYDPVIGTVPPFLRNLTKTGGTTAPSAMGTSAGQTADASPSATPSASAAAADRAVSPCALQLMWMTTFVGVVAGVAAVIL